MKSLKYPKLPILLVDDETDALETIKMVLLSVGLDHVILCSDSRKAMASIAKTNAAVILLDLTMPYITGDELLKQISQEFPSISVIVITGQNRLETAVGCMKNGAFDYVVKPVETNRLISTVKRAIEIQELRDENRSIRQNLMSTKVEHPEAFAKIITANSGMRSIFKYIEAIANSPQPILITGETGVGKELFARAIHKLSELSGPFVSVNVAGLDDNAFSDTLFGHLKGAFTGAESVRSGLIEKAAGGTLFLDEIGDLNHNSQIKLLRVIQEREYLPLGADVNKKSNIRILVATNQDLDQQQNSGAFRRDLFYRISTHYFKIPPLRQRLDDLPLLLDHFLQIAADTLNKEKPSYPKELLILLNNYPFLGNIREFEAIVFDAVSRHDSGMLSMKVFKHRMGQNTDAFGPETPIASEGNSLFSELEELPSIRCATQALIAEAMKRAQGNQTIASRYLGISRPALSRRLKSTEE